jgi:hypothetical protein
MAQTWPDLIVLAATGLFVGLLQWWGELHAVRTVMSWAAFIMMLRGAFLA